MQYVLALLQFQAPGWAPASPSGPSGSGSSAKEPLVQQSVTLASVNAAGVVPRSYAPPGYVDKHEADYNTTVGYLENGNQRCVCALASMSLAIAIVALDHDAVHDRDGA